MRTTSGFVLASALALLMIVIVGHAMLWPMYSYVLCGLGYAVAFMALRYRHLSRQHQSTLETLSRYQSGLQVSPSALAILDAQTRLLDANAAMRSLLGGNSDKEFSQALPPTLMTYVQAHASSLEADQKAEAFEITFQREQDAIARWRFVLHRLPGTSTVFFLHGQDLSYWYQQNQQLELRLMRSRALLARVMDVIPAPVYIKDAQSRYRQVNDAFCVDRAQTTEQILGRSVMELFADSGIASISAREDQEVIAGRRVYKQEEYHVPETGKIRYRVISKAVAEDEDGQPVVVGVNLEAARWNLDHNVLRRVAEQDARVRMRAELEQSAARARAYVQRLIDVIPQPVYIKDASSRYVMVNDALAAGFGCRKDEMVGRYFYEMNISQDTRETTLQEDQEVLAGKVVLKEQCRPHRLTGKPMYRQISKARCIDIDGQPVIVCASFDLTSLRESEQGLKEALEREVQRREMTQSFIQRLIDVIPEPVYVKDAEGILLMVNQAFAREYGVDGQAVIGTEFARVIGKMRDLETVRQEDASALAGTAIYKEECVRSPISGAKVYMIIAKGACMDAEGRKVLVGTHFNVSLWREAEQRAVRALELQQRMREFLQTVFDSLPDPLFVRNERLEYVMVNKAFLRDMHCTLEEVIGRRREEFMPETLSKQFNDFAWAPTDVEGQVQERQVNFTDLEGRARWFIARQIAVRDVEGQPIILGMANDVTSLRETEERWMRAKETAEKANAAKSEFLANMSHELRTPMHAILSFARIGDERAELESAEKLRGYFARIVHSGERLMGLLDALLDISKLEAGRMNTRFERVELSPLITEARIEFEALLAARQIEVLWEETPCGAVRGDVILIGQVVRNLLSNAVKYSPSPSRIEIRLGQHLDEHANAMAEIVVADQGVGIPEGEQELIFEKFVQSSLTRNGAGGTGLGLSICKEIVLLHGGRIFARNRNAGGAEFVVQLPLYEAASDEQRDED